MIDTGGEYIITGTTTSNTITVTAAEPVVITLDHVNIDVTGESDPYKCAFNSGTHVTLYLKGTNTLKSGRRWAGLQVEGAEQLVIGNAPGQTGSLEAIGGYYGAGIGGGEDGTGGIITINNSTITALGGRDAAGIGGGDDAGGGTVTINGGVITATSGGYAAAIGGGDNGSGGTVNIHGGIVTADNRGLNQGAGIGGGWNGPGADVTVTGGTVTAYGGKNGSGIGSGYLTSLKSAGSLAVTGGKITAFGGDSSAGIGGGEGGTGAAVSISGGTVTAAGGEYGAGIGGGQYNTWIGTPSGAGGTVTISGGTVTAIGGMQAAGIGGGSGGDGGITVIDSGSVKVSTVDAGAANSGEKIGKGYNGSSSGTLSNTNAEPVTEMIVPTAVAAVDPVSVYYDILTGSPEYRYKYVGTGHGEGDTNLYFYLPETGSVARLELSSDKTSSEQGELVTFTASIIPTAAGGSVEFYDGLTQLATVPLAGGQAVYQTGSLAVGSHQITAKYVGTGEYFDCFSDEFAHNVQPGTEPQPGDELRDRMDTIEEETKESFDDTKQEIKESFDDTKQETKDRFADLKTGIKSKFSR